MKKGLTKEDAERLAGQAIMPRLSPIRYREEDAYRASIDNLVIGGKCTGFCLFGGTEENAVEVLDTLDGIAAASEKKLLVSGDFEFGLPMRIAGGTEFPDAMAISKSGDPHNAYKIGRAIGEEMKRLGILWNFAPVADVNSNPQNPIINTRSFGESPDVVIEYASRFLAGAQAAGVASAAKHFPGHGDTLTDSHSALPLLRADKQRFDQVELPPFRKLVAEGVESVMPGHLATPELARAFGAGPAETMLPATMSKALITNLLREDMGFRGIVVTDSLEMGALTRNFSLAEVVVGAMNAGVDILLMPPDAEEAHMVLVNAIMEGQIDPDSIRASSERVALFKRRFVGTSTRQRLSDLEQHGELARRVAAEGISTRGTLSTLSSDIPLVLLHDDREMFRERAEYFATRLVEMRGRERPALDVHFSTPSAFLKLVEALPERFSLATFHKARGFVDGAAEVGTVPEGLRNARAALSAHRLEHLMLFGSPYLDTMLEGIQIGAVIKAFSESRPSINAVIDLVL